MKWLALMVWLLHIAGLTHGQFIDTASVEPEDRTYESLESELSASQKKPSTSPATREYASEKINIRKFDQQKWQEIVTERNYTDAHKRKTQQDQKTSARAGNSQGSGSRTRDEGDPDRYEYDTEETSAIDLRWLGPLGQIIFYAAIATIIVVILMQIVRNTSFKSNPKRPFASALTAEDIHDISELDTEQLIQQAHSERDYKLAIRLYFLDLLKKLNDNGVIIWTKEKTNRDYLSELFSKQYYFEEIRRLTQAYERVWYGEHLPTEEHYHELSNEFREINQKFKAS